MRVKNVLLAEDNPDDAFIFQMMIKRSGLPQIVHWVQDGQQAINWLSGTGEYSNREKCPMPDLLFLDLKMPLKSGFDVLEWLRNKSQVENLPVIILSSSDEKTDVNRACQLGATTYFVKSPQLQDVIRYLHRT
jgi:CheY-like chemotaxis protein